MKTSSTTKQTTKNDAPPSGPHLKDADLTPDQAEAELSQCDRAVTEILAITYAMDGEDNESMAEIRGWLASLAHSLAIFHNHGVRTTDQKAGAR
jgi:hypothetical protein